MMTGAVSMGSDIAADHRQVDSVKSGSPIVSSMLASMVSISGGALLSDMIRIIGEDINLFL